MRRSFGEGTIYYNKHQMRYEAQFYYKDSNGNSARKTFTSKKSKTDALKKGKAFMKEREKGIDYYKSKYTLADWLDYWLENYKKNSTKIKTYERYSSLVKKNVNPFIGETIIKDLTIMELQKHFNHLLEKGGERNQGLAPRSVNATRRLLISALEDAIELKYIESNPARKTKPCRVGRVELHVLTRAESDRLIDAARRSGRPYWIIIILAVWTGMRISEIFGLEWKNIDLNNASLKVEKTVVTTNKGIVIQNSAKTATSNRTILLSVFVVEALKRYKLFLKVRHRRLGSRFKNSDFVLANQDGVPRSPNSFSSHNFKSLLKEAGIDTHVRVHDLRHTHATWLLEANVNVKVVSERLGHSNCRITLDTYAHVLRTMQEKAVDALDDLYNKSK